MCVCVCVEEQFNLKGNPRPLHSTFHPWHDLTPAALERDTPEKTAAFNIVQYGVIEKNYKYHYNSASNIIKYSIAVIQAVLFFSRVYFYNMSVKQLNK